MHASSLFLGDCCGGQLGFWGEVWGDADSVSLQKDNVLNGQLILHAPEVSGNPQDPLQTGGPSIEGELVQGVVDQVTFYCSSDGIYLVSGQLEVLNIVEDLYWKGLCGRGSG